MAVDNQQALSVIKLHQKQSKTDPFGRGADIVLGKTGCNLCPVAGYVAARGDRQGPFFMTKEAKPLTKHVFMTEVRKVLARLGLTDHQYAGHSFQIDAATSPALVGVEDSTIQVLGRWQSGAFLCYIRTHQQTLAAISSTLAAQGHRVLQQ